MKVREAISQVDDAAAAEDLFEMANLFPRTTGLPMTVWVSPRGNARHDLRVKVNMTHGNQMNAANTAVVAVRPSPRVLAGQLSSAVDVYVKSDGMVTDTLIDTLHSLAEIYPDHIWKEDYLLLPMADKLLSEGDQETLAVSLRAIDSTTGERARRTVEDFCTAIRLCSESACLWEQANVA